MIAGSSPLTRGKQDDGCGDENVPRLIPAHAGKTTVTVLSATSRKAHPRSRGENLIGAVRTFVVTGSSPLTRGKRRFDQIDQPRGRLIPAHAGKTSLRAILTHIEAAHPRSRGENQPG